MTKKFNDEMQKLLQKARMGGQVTLSDLENLQGLRRVVKKDPDAPPSKILSPKTLLKRAKEGLELNKWELAELAKDSELAIAYAEFTQKPFPECEDYLLNGRSCRYVSKYFEQLFPQVNKKYEDWLVNNHQVDMITNYCSQVLKGRWKEGEEVVLADKSWRREDILLGYHSRVVRGRWPELERIIFSKKTKKDDRRGLAEGYFKNLGFGSHEDLECRLLKSGTPKMLYDYALRCVGGRLPDGLHNKMILVGKGWSRKYLKGLDARKRMLSRFLASLNDEERAEMFRKPVSIAS